MNFLRILSRDREQPKSQAEMLANIEDTVRTKINRGRFLGEKVGFGPNFVHAYVTRGETGEFGAPGSIENIGWSTNLRTTVGMDWIHRLMGGYLPAIVTLGTATSTTATTWVKTAAGFTTDTYKGGRIVVPVTGLTTEPVYGNVLSNDATTLTVDQWWTAADATGTTPGNSAGLFLNGQGPARFIALTTDTSGPATSDTALTSEITTNGLQRALATFAHTGGTQTYTLTKTFSATGTHTNVHKAGNFTGGYGSAGGGILVAATNLNADATLASGDSLAVTWTWTLPTAGA